MFEFYQQVSHDPCYGYSTALTLVAMAYTEDLDEDELRGALESLCGHVWELAQLQVELAAQSQQDWAAALRAGGAISLGENPSRVSRGGQWLRQWRRR
ncbi:Uncharacterised protein [Mycobacteroides abscessus subsp. abscessus]|nr:Uncharacterised protein [Mycobacteroides abscessus subsp. abscessus]